LFFLFDLLGQEYKQVLIHFLVQMKTLKNPYEINWPLAKHFDYFRFDYGIFKAFQSGERRQFPVAVA
jgi:hypothetical protein